MIAENMRELVLEDSTFEEARQNFNRVLQRLFKNMNDHGSTEGAITLKIDVTMIEEFIPNYDPQIEGESRRILKPSFKHKVSSTITVKDELTGSKNPEMELVYDEERGIYVLAYVSNTEQRTIFDKDAPWNEQQQKPGQEALETDPEKEWMNVPQLPGVVADENALPGEVQSPEDEIEDAQFREVGEDADGGEPEDQGEDDGYSYEEPPEE